jgi:hypothetical protein
MINKGNNGDTKPKVQLINLALHAILTFSGKSSYSKSQLKGTSPRSINGRKILTIK